MDSRYWCLICNAFVPIEEVVYVEIIKRYNHFCCRPGIYSAVYEIPMESLKAYVKELMDAAALEPDTKVKA